LGQNNPGPHPGIDLSKPSASRVYDRLLGGGHNFPPDRELATRLLACMPDAAHAARSNRAFLRRVVHHLVDAGVRQFLDLGSGIPTVGNVHEIARKRAPRCTVVYVDNDPIATAHSRLILGQDPRTVAVEADLRDVDAVVSAPEVQAMLDFTRPIAVLMCAVLHFVPDSDDPVGIVRRYCDAVRPGSYVALSHATDDDYPEDLAAAISLYRDGGISGTARGRHAVTELFTGLELVEPGVVFADEWRPEGRDEVDPRRSRCYAGLALKPDRAAGSPKQDRPGQTRWDVGIRPREQDRHGRYP